MGKTVQVNNAYSGVFFTNYLRAYNGGESVTLTEAEYAALPNATLAAISITASGLPDPSRTTNSSPVSLQDAVNQSIAVANSGALSGTYGRVVGVPAPTGVVATDWANINAAVTTANAFVASGGGNALVQFQGCPYSAGVLTAYAVGNHTIGLVSGVSFRGVEPVVGNNGALTNLPDGSWNYQGGTVLLGDGTADCFAGNTATLGALPANQGLTNLKNVTIEKIGFDTFAQAINVGGVDNPGLIYSRVARVWAKNCTGWGFKFLNFFHTDFDNIYTADCAVGGQYYAGIGDTGQQMIPGNSNIREVYNYLWQGATDLRKVRGIVFDLVGAANSSLNQIHCDRIQNNGFNRTLLSVTATFTNTSTNVAVPDGTKFAPGMLVNFTGAGNGFTINNVYYVQSVTGNNIVLGNQRSTAAIAATGSGTLTLQTYGMANIEMYGLASSSVSHVDTEGVASVGLYLENCAAEFKVLELPQTTLVDIVGRTVTYSQITCLPAAKTDFDSGTAATSSFHGTKSFTYGYPLRGMAKDNYLSTNVLNLSGGASATAQGDMYLINNNVWYPNAGLAERMFPRDAAITLAPYNQGNVVAAPSSAVTFGLFTIIAASPSNTNVGVWFKIINVGTSPITVTTDGAQLFNNVAAKTSLTVGAQQSMKVVAARLNSGTFFWFAEAPAALA